MGKKHTNDEGEMECLTCVQLPPLEGGMQDNFPRYDIFTRWQTTQVFLVQYKAD